MTAILSYILNHPGCHIADIVAALNLIRADVFAEVCKLEQAGQVVRIHENGHLFLYGKGATTSL